MRSGKTADKIGVGCRGAAGARFQRRRRASSSRRWHGAQRFTRRAAEAAQGTGEAKDALAEIGASTGTFATAGGGAETFAAGDRLLSMRKLAAAPQGTKLDCQRWALGMSAERRVPWVVEFCSGFSECRSPSSS